MNKILSLKEWQKEITKEAERKGFKWTEKDIDTMLLRIISEVIEASEYARDYNLEGIAEELADIFIRLANTAEVLNIDLEKEVLKKYNKNINRSFLHGRKRP